MRRSLSLLALLIATLLPSSATARDIPVSSWTLDLRVAIALDFVHDRTSPRLREEHEGSGRMQLVGSGRGLYIPRRAGSRSRYLGWGDELHQKPGPVTGHSLSVDPFRTIDERCHGILHFGLGATLLESKPFPEYHSLPVGAFLHWGAGGLSLQVTSALSKVEHCNTRQMGSPVGLNGWPEHVTFAVPADAHRERTLTLHAEWWHHRAICTTGEETEGSGPPPAVATATEGDETCTGTDLQHITATLKLARMCVSTLHVSGDTAWLNCPGAP
jgi:hypothetical protein